eukprot:1143202-Pelagomonas_calceolata.AAC.1
MEVGGGARQPCSWKSWWTSGSVDGPHGHSCQGDPEAGEGRGELAAAVAQSQEGKGVWVGRLSEPMKVSEDTADERWRERVRRNSEPVQERRKDAQGSHILSSSRGPRKP